MGAVVAGTLALAAAPAQAGETQAGETRGRELWGAVTIAPGREGVVEVAGYGGAALGAGSVLTLTAPGGTAVTDAPLDARGYRGTVAPDGRSGTYTFNGGTGGTPGTGAWRGLTFPFVLSVPADAVPGTRLSDCSLRLLDARGRARDRGACVVTVGLPEPTLSRPHSGVPLDALPEASGTAHPGAQITVRDAGENEVCTTTAAADGLWSCAPGVALPAGPGRLQATATLNGVSAASEQITIMVTA
jgi:hypothetical protein